MFLKSNALGNQEVVLLVTCQFTSVSFHVSPVAKAKFSDHRWTSETHSFHIWRMPVITSPVCNKQHYALSTCRFAKLTFRIKKIQQTRLKIQHFSFYYDCFTYSTKFHTQQHMYKAAKNKVGETTAFRVSPDSKRPCYQPSCKFINKEPLLHFKCKWRETCTAFKRAPTWEYLWRTSGSQMSS